MLLRYVAYHINFNSHAHVERDYLCNEGARAEIISTHTLTWSVTRDHVQDGGQTYISTHTLTWSVT